MSTRLNDRQSQCLYKESSRSHRHVILSLLAIEPENRRRVINIIGLPLRQQPHKDDCYRQSSNAPPASVIRFVCIAGT